MVVAQEGVDPVGGQHPGTTDQASPGQPSPGRSLEAREMSLTAATGQRPR
jgi:hypothetical protein